MADRSVQDDSEQVIERVWNALSKSTTSKKSKNKTFDIKDTEKLTELCTLLSSLKKKEAIIVYGLIKKYNRENSGPKISNNENFPYSSQKIENDIQFEEVETMPIPLLTLLYTYVKKLDD